ncbi:MAG TPA: hypothetical protein VKY65_17995 [Alphaproteobacteria bacterium]|nr:hypothetical protein [Alphaproteobacteria bacterium]
MPATDSKALKRKAKAAPRAAPLSARREAFCRAYVELALLYNGAKVGAAAYRRAYRPQRANAHTIRSKAHLLLKEPRIQARIAELRGERLQAEMSDAWVLGQLGEIVRRALDESEFDPRVATRALQLIGRQLGMFNARGGEARPKPDDIAEGAETADARERLARRIAELAAGKDEAGGDP